jgi:hypothetical protein
MAAKIGVSIWRRRIGEGGGSRRKWRKPAIINGVINNVGVMKAYHGVSNQAGVMALIS